MECKIITGGFSFCGTDIKDLGLEYVPEKDIDGKEFFSWERYFTSLLIEKTHGTWLQYSKGSLNPVYLHGKLMQQILAALPKDIRKLLSI